MRLLSRAKSLLLRATPGEVRGEAQRAVAGFEISQRDRFVVRIRLAYRDIAHTFLNASDKDLPFSAGLFMSTLQVLDFASIQRPSSRRGR